MEKTQEFDDEIEIDLRELLAVLLSQWLLILVVTVLGGGIATFSLVILKVTHIQIFALVVLIYIAFLTMKIPSTL